MKHHCLRTICRCTLLWTFSKGMCNTIDPRNGRARSASLRSAYSLQSDGEGILTPVSPSTQAYRWTLPAHCRLCCRNWEWGYVVQGNNPANLHKALILCRRLVSYTKPFYIFEKVMKKVNCKTKTKAQLFLLFPSAINNLKKSLLPCSHVVLASLHQVVYICQPNIL